MKKKVLSILVKNSAGVLSRVSGLFSRRGYNITSLSVGETENPEYSRMIVVVYGDDRILEQIEKQLYKLIEVESVTELLPDYSVCRELMLVTVSVTPEKRQDIISIASIFRANIVDVKPESMMIELTGDQTKIEAFLNLMEDHGIIEISRTGLTGLKRG
ncbi:MAG: acetolactate synthase small subunit [Lachnospiraceae bacterium]|nr:acetolactate synthase small subunit [Lachnospiraceae bacterium]